MPSPEYASALKQAEDYIVELAAEYAEPTSEYFGIILDGEHVGFIHYDPERSWMRTARAGWTEHTALLVLERFRAHSKHPLDADKIAEAMGPESAPAQQMLPAMVDALRAPSGRVSLLFAEWQRLFGQSVGTESHQSPGMYDWAFTLGISTPTDEPYFLPKFFFALHTYYAIVIKLLTADIVGTIRTRSLSLFTRRLTEGNPTKRAEILHSMENNVFFEELGISNFMEGDFFSWYLDLYDEAMDAGVLRLCHSIGQFEPTTPLLSPSHVTDLYKQLYQSLIPDRIRHDLGEFYTPDWLADYVLERTGFASEPDSRLLDPACGSGTFLVRALKMFKRQEKLNPTAVIQHLQNGNIAGFDLNPLAVTAARANLILAIVDELAETAERVSLPIYLADSIYSPEIEEDHYVYRLETEHGPVDMRFPVELVVTPGFADVLREVERYMWEGGDKPAVEDLPPTSLVVQNGCLDFYRQIWTLDEQDWDKIWCRIVHNRFASVMVGQFDYVVGNPPWVIWSNLPASYREATKHVCDKYNIFSSDSWVGGIESDISTVLTYAAADRWLAHGGTLGFIITQTVFKTRSAQGFRRFSLPDGTPLGVSHVDDMTALQPFDGAANRTATLILKKGESTRYPVPYLVWKRQSRSHSFRTTSPLPFVVRQVHIWAQEAVPVGDDGGQWITAPTGHTAALLSLLGGPGLRGRKGTTTDFNNIYWGRIVEGAESSVLLENNLSHHGHQVEQVQSWIERELVFPLARGRDVKRFSVAPPETVIILPQVSMSAFDRQTMEGSYPLALAYLAQYEEEACIGCRVGRACRRGLRDRSTYSNPRYHDAMGDFWAIWNVGPYTFQPYKVAWKEVSSKFEAAVISTVEMDGLGTRTHIPDHKLMFTAYDDLEEAHFVCGVLNSSLIRQFAEAASLSTSRGSRIFEDLNIPRFDPDDPAHSRVAELSLTAHAGSQQLNEDFEEELDQAVSEALGHAAAASPGPSMAADSLTSSLREAVYAAEAAVFPRSETLLRNATFVAIDVETTGFSAEGFGDRIVEVAAVRFTLSGVQQTWQRQVWPGVPVRSQAYQVHGLALEDLMLSPCFDEVWPSLEEFIGDAFVVAHNAPFDASFLGAHLSDIGLATSHLVFDTLKILRAQFSLSSNRLSEAVAALGVEGRVTHAALADATATAQLMLRLYDLLGNRAQLHTVGQFASLMGEPPISIPSNPRTGRFIALARTKGRAKVTYQRDGRTSLFSGIVETAVIGRSRGYITLCLESDTRLLLRTDRVASLEAIE